MIHTNMIAFGFLTNAFFGMLYWTVPAADRSVRGQHAGWAV